MELLFDPPAPKAAATWPPSWATIDEPDASWPLLEALHDASGTAAPLGEFAALEDALDAAETAAFAANRAMAAHLAAIRRAFDCARQHPALYLNRSALGARDEQELAVRAVAAELSMRLKLPSGTVRTRAFEAEVLHDRLPLVWHRFESGVAAYPEVRAAVDAAVGFDPDDPGLARFDEAVADLIGSVTPARFRQRLRALRARYDRALLEARHTRAYADRRVQVEHVDDGMSWVSLFVSSVDAARIRARLDATCHAQAGAPDERRSLDQLRADTAVAWLAGDGTPTAASVEVIVTVPVLALAGADDEPAQLDGAGPIDLATARQLFADAPSFLRLAVDPVTSAPLALDRTRYRPSAAQRTWLALRHGTCTRPGCDRLAVSSDLDHVRDWFTGGPTDVANLAPTCRSDHRLKHAARFTVTKSKLEGTVTWRSPTGRAYTDPPPF
ncbi:DUF222 domain-containing protein [Agromyces sp. CFH 90414]|uniref:DUF222 domain-containing protein n=1 Tax=Agromyces agglutinans TaxID=2662258 RepID=A0A6I2F672_9MICO|nr:HNH endonuclease signature motif containing protein [Agromyces agglutinans]MRG59764.1 DUF222 domain-containing protein [Agromyces agglutinans]